MSYWCGFEDTDIDSINMTSNVAPMWRRAGADLAAMKGKTAKEVRFILATAVRNMLAEPEKYKALNPGNGWGDYRSCVEYLTRLALMAGEVDPADTFRANH
jgi:hypothetical protein